MYIDVHDYRTETGTSFVFSQFRCLIRRLNRLQASIYCRYYVHVTEKFSGNTNITFMFRDKHRLLILKHKGYPIALMEIVCFYERVASKHTNKEYANIYRTPIWWRVMENTVVWHLYTVGYMPSTPGGNQNSGRHQMPTTR